MWGRVRDLSFELHMLCYMNSLCNRPTVLKTGIKFPLQVAIESNREPCVRKLYQVETN